MRAFHAPVWLLAAMALAQDAPKRPAMPEPKNLKVLRGQTPEQLIDSMRSFRTALNVQCSYCHVAGDFASDQNPKKEIARNMILMAREINAKFPPDGRMRVSCFTCHHGATQPATAAPPEASKPGN